MPKSRGIRAPYLKWTPDLNLFFWTVVRTKKLHGDLCWAQLATDLNAMLQEEFQWTGDGTTVIPTLSRIACQVHEGQLRAKGFAEVYEAERQKRIQSGRPLLDRPKIFKERETRRRQMQWTPELSFFLWTLATTKNRVSWPDITKEVNGVLQEGYAWAGFRATVIPKVTENACQVHLSWLKTNSFGEVYEAELKRRMQSWATFTCSLKCDSRTRKAYFYCVVDSRTNLHALVFCPGLQGGFSESVWC